MDCLRYCRLVVSDVTGFKALISKISGSCVPSGRPWDLSESSTYEKQCRRLGMRKCKQNWQLISACAESKVLSNRKVPHKRSNVACHAEFATKQDLDEVRSELFFGCLARIDGLTLSLVVKLEWMHWRKAALSD
jgi:hypothetical protein